MATTTLPVTSVLEMMGHSIQVSGNRCFQNSWREAILYFLFGVWSNDKSVMSRPKIMFGGLTLDLAPTTGRYYAYGVPPDRKMPNIPDSQALFVSAKQLSVQDGLVRFVKDRNIRALVIEFPDRKNEIVYLWKKERRGEYGCWANVPIEYRNV